MKLRASKKALVLCVIIVLTLILPQAAHGQENVPENTVNYSVKAILPENQRDTKQSYFDLRVEPGQEQLLQVRVYNHGSTPITINAALNTASTNPGGVLDYSRPGIRDESMKTAISDLAYIPEPQLVIPPNSSKLALFSIKMPDEPFDGILLGGIHFSKAPDEQTPETAAEGSTTIVNEYAYVIAVKLSETDTVVEPALNLKKAEPGLSNFKTALIATVQNSAAVVARDVDFEAKVFREGESSPMREASQAGVDMAPNSVFDYAIDWENSKIQQGNYTLRLKAVQGERVWEWEQSFTVEPAKAGEINNGAVGLRKSWYTTTAFIASMCAALLLVIVFLLYLLLAAKRKRKLRTEG